MHITMKAEIWSPLPPYESYYGQGQHYNVEQSIDEEALQMRYMSEGDQSPAYSSGPSSYSTSPSQVSEPFYTLSPIPK